MRVLAFDTSASSLSISLLEGKKILSKKTILESSKQSEFLVFEIEEILRRNKIWYQDLDLIAATNGPGSFTGVRVGLTAARILKIATNLPLVLVNSCEAIAFANRDVAKKIFVILDAKIDEFFCAKFLVENGRLKAASEVELVKLEDISKFYGKEEFFICGSGKKIAAEILKKENLKFKMNEKEDVIEADFIGLLALEKFSAGEISENLDPIYLREPRIEKRKR
jgi:tRNA threonylcarbamoyladenosine biosynthesis protein TsaB